MKYYVLYNLKKLEQSNMADSNGENKEEERDYVCCVCVWTHILQLGVLLRNL